MTSVDLEIGVRIRELRRARGLSQRELAKLIGVSPHSLSSAERGAPLTASRLLAVARVLGVPVGQLLGEPRRRPPLALHRDQQALAADVARLDHGTRMAVVQFVHRLARRTVSGGQP